MWQMKKTRQDSVKVPLIGAFSSENRSQPHVLALSHAFNPENTFPNIPASLINEPRQLFTQATSLCLIAENEHMQITAALFLSEYAGSLHQNCAIQRGFSLRSGAGWRGAYPYLWLVNCSADGVKSP
ncbi:hypothetical protein V462_00290 [Pantoea ananatis 15320]|nr:hypothetical protein V462_00290 [Pantoea ananatis 15320]